VEKLSLSAYILLRWISIVVGWYLNIFFPYIIILKAVL
jgi:hypothetical protein